MNFLNATRPTNRDEKNRLLTKEDAQPKQPVSNHINDSPYEQNQNPPYYFFPVHGTHGKEHLPASLDFLVRARRR